jgi:phosphoribosylaminoimidazolecarboxamide formyltransferase/IMP cyclohydrolase
MSKRRAIISLTDKTGVVDFAKELVNLDFEIISTGGTAKVLREAGIEVIGVSDITGFPECLDGRVKTLHPKLYAGILAIRDNKEHMEQIESLGVEKVDVVAINLYPFRKTIEKEGVTFEEAIENIDIGGPSMIRASAKNWQDVAVIVDPADYPKVIEEMKANGEVSRETKLKLAAKVFTTTAQYDAMISKYINEKAGNSVFNDKLTLTYEKVQEMRYGENPHQSAAFYKEVTGGDFSGTLTAAKQLHGKELSYNNINDTNGALDVLKEFGDTPCVVAVKHANPCGVGTGKTLYEAYMNAYNADPVSIYGGIVVTNMKFDKQTAEETGKIFLEIIVAPSYDAGAIEVLTQKKNLRVMELPNISKPNRKEMLDMKKVAGGLLVQDLNDSLVNLDEIKCVTDKKPTESEMRDLLFAWRVVKHTKSNAIVLAKDGMTTGVGPGQTNRVTALELAIKYAGEKAKGSVLASDAYFPFSDNAEVACKAGITAIIQPGGSIRDQDSIDVCNKYGIAMVYTGIRHFKH